MFVVQVTQEVGFSSDRMDRIWKFLLMCAFSPGPLHSQDEIGERIQREGSSLHMIGRALHQKPALMIPLSLTSDLQNPEKMNLCLIQ